MADYSVYISDGGSEYQGTPAQDWTIEVPNTEIELNSVFARGDRILFTGDQCYKVKSGDDSQFDYDPQDGKIPCKDGKPTGQPLIVTLDSGYKHGQHERFMASPSTGTGGVCINI